MLPAFAAHDSFSLHRPMNSPAPADVVQRQLDAYNAHDLEALLEYLGAREGKRFMVACGQTDWDMTLAFYADMGGFAQWPTVQMEKP